MKRWKIKCATSLGNVSKVLPNFVRGISGIRGVFLQDANIGQVPVMLIIIEPVPDNEFVGDIETNIIHVHFNLAAGRLIEQRCNFQ